MKIAYCIKCGNKFPEEAIYCPYCGAKIYKPVEDALTPIGVEEKPAPLTVPIVEKPNPVAEPVMVDHASVTENPVIPVVTLSEPEVEPIKDDAPAVEDERALSMPPEELIDKNKPEAEEQDTAPEEEQTVNEDELEDPKIGICILSFFFPLVGFIAAVSNKGTNKKKSKTYAMWAWIGLGLNVFLSIIQSAI